MKQNILVPVLVVLLAFALHTVSYFISPPPANTLITYCVASFLGIASILIIYFISLKISKSNIAAVFSAILAAGVHTYGWRIASHHIHAAELCLFLTIILSILYIKKTAWYLPVLLTIPYAFFHIYSLALIPVILIYVLLLKLEGMHLNKPELKSCVFSSIVIIVMFAFFTATPALIVIVSEYAARNYYALSAANFKLTTVFAIIGALPVYLGLIGAYECVLHRNKGALLLLSAAIVFFIASLANLVTLRLTLPYLAMSFAALSAVFYAKIDKIIIDSVASKHRWLIHGSVLAVFIALSTIHWIITL